MKPWSWRAPDTYLLAAVYMSAIAVAGLGCAALFTPDIPATHDAPAHYTYAYLFDHALGQGQFPVRWVEWVRTGHSQPLFNFYQPGLYYLTALTHLLVPSLARSLQVTIAGAWLAGMAFTFLLLRPFGRPAALAAAVCLALSPYLVLDLFVRGAYPEFMAIMMAPGVLWASDNTIVRGLLRDRLALAGLLCVMALCHLPTLMIFSPVFASYAIWKSVALRTPRRLAALVPSCLLAFAMAAFYVVPALAEIGHIRMAELTSNYFDFHHHFVAPQQWFDYAWGFGGSVDGAKDQMSFQVGQIQWLTLALAAVVALCHTWRRRQAADGLPPPSALLLWLGAAAAALFLTSGASVQVWERLTPLAYVQFPWRLLMVVSVASSMLAGLLLAKVRVQRAQTLLALFVIGGQVFLMKDHLKPSGYIERARLDIDKPYWRYGDTTRSVAFLEEGYRPVTVRQVPTTALGRWTIVEGEGRVRSVEVRDDALHLMLDAAKGLRLSINTPYFPGWSVRIDGADATIRPHSDLGYMEVLVPPGAHRVDAVFISTRVRRWSNLVSAVAFCVFVALLTRASALGRRKWTSS